MMGSVDREILFWIPVENNPLSTCIPHEITAMWYIIKIISCNTPIDDVDSHNPYFMGLYDGLDPFQRKWGTSPRNLFSVLKEIQMTYW